MNFFIRNKFIVFMALIATTAMPILAEAQETDNADGPTIMIVPSSEEAVASPDAAAAKKDEKKSAAGKDYSTDFGFIGAGAGASERQYFSVSPTLGYAGEGTQVKVTTPIGYGPDVFRAKVDLLGMRTNGYELKKPTVAGFLNGSGEIGNSGIGQMNAVAGAMVPVPIGNTGCAVAPGIGIGGAYGNQMGAVKKEDGTHETSPATTAAVGPGGYLGGWCQIGGVKVMLANQLFANSLHWNNSDKNPTFLVGQSKAAAWYQVNADMAIGAYASVDYDARDNKVVASGGGGVDLVFTFGNAPKAYKSSVTEEKRPVREEE